MRRSHSFFVLFVVLFSVSVCAEDIAYVVKDTAVLNHDYLNAIADLGLTVRVIDDNNLNMYNLSNYRMVLVGNDRFSTPADIPVNDYPTLISNQYYIGDWYWANSVSSIGSSQPLQARNVILNQITRGLPESIQVYDSCCKNGISTPMYYLAKESRSAYIKSVTSLMSDNYDAVVATTKKGTVLKSGQVSNAKGVFFGITESYMWTQDAETLFKNSILWLVNEPPKLASTIPPRSFDEDTTLLATYDLSQYFSDRENDTITYSMTGGVHVKANITGSMVTLYADKDWFGSEQVKFVATEEDQSTNSNVVTITVNAVNDAPVLSALNDLTFVEGDYINVNATATDADRDTVGITYSAPLDASQGVWQTSIGNAGTYTVTVTANDYRGGTDTKTFTLTVLPKVYINEFSLEGWVELYSPQNYDLSLASWTLSSPTKQVTLSSMITPNGFLVSNMNLSANDQILLKKDGYVVDSVAFGSYNDGNTADNAASPPLPKSSARKSDGYDSGNDKNDFIILDLNTKGLSNTADVTPPAVSLVSPEDNFVLTALSRQTSATFSVTDNKAVDLVCDLYINTSGTFESVGSLNVRSGNRGTFTLSSMQDGSYIWNVRCYDGKNYAFAPSNRTLVVNVNDAPVITGYTPVSLTPEVYENSALAFTHTSTDPESGPLTYIWKVGTTEKATTKDFVYTPGFFDAGNRVVTLTVKDNGNLTATQEWNVKVLNFNRKPYLNGTIPGQVLEEDKMSSLYLTDYFSDDDKESLSYRVVSEDLTKVHCSVGLSRLYMEPAKDYNGDAECVIVANDGIDDSDNATVLMVVAPVNDAPRMRGDIPAQTWDEDTNNTEAFNLNDYFYDVDSSALTYNFTGNSNITISIADNGNVSFYQPADWYGSEYVRFSASDGNLTTQSDTIRLNVRNINDAPEGLPIPDVVIDEDTNTSIDVAPYFTDKDNTYLTYSVAEKDATKVDCIMSGHNMTIRPAPNFSGNATCAMTASDSTDNSPQNIVKIIVNAVNDAPVLKSSVPSKTWDEDTSLNDAFDLDDYFEDVDNANLTYTFSGNSNITITISPENKVSFSQPANWFGVETVTFTGSDGEYSVNSNAVTLTVVDVNEPPVMEAIPEQTILEDSTFNQIIMMASDVDGTIESFAVTEEDKSKVECDVSGNTLSLLPAKDFFGDASCKITVTDNSGSTDWKVVVIHVTNVNDAPVIDSYTPSSDPVIGEDGTQPFSIAYHDIDTPESGLSVTWYVNNGSVGSGNTFNYVASGKGTFEVKAVVSDSEYTSTKTWSLIATDCPITKKFDGSTTKFCDLTQEQLANATCVTLEKTGYGKIEFCDSTIDLRDTIYLDKSIDISPGFIAIDTSALPAFAGKAATITLYNIQSDGTPKIYYKSGFTLDPKVVATECPPSICSNINYADSVLSFRAAHFSAYKSSASSITEPNPQNCADLNGYICGSSDTCAASWLQALDTSRCCSVACASSGAPDNNSTDGNKTYVNLDSCKSGVIGDIDVKINEPDSGDDFKPGDTISVEIKVKNNANNDVDARVKAILFDKDKDDELDSDSDDVTVDSDDSETVTIDLVVPDSVKDKDNFMIFVKAYEDGKESSNCNEDSITVDMKRETHDVAIMDEKLSPQSLSCDNALTLSFTADNIGKSDESLYFTVLQPSLNVDFKSDSFDLDEGDDTPLYVNLMVPKNTTKGAYPLELGIYLDDGKLLSSKTLDLNVLDCISNGFTSEGLPISAGIPEGSASLLLLRSSFELEPGASMTVPAEITNKGKKKTTFTLGVSGISSYATLLEAPKITLSPGASSNVYVYVKTLPDSSGKKSMSVDLMVDGQIVDSKAVSIDLSKTTDQDMFSGFVFRPAGMGSGTMVMLFITALIVIFIVVALVWATYKPRRR
jgi:hypothetical protein